MGRKRKLPGTVHKGLHGGSVRLAKSTAKFEHIVKPSPRGKTGKAFLFTSVLKERAPIVYALVVDHFKRPEKSRVQSVEDIVKEYRQTSGVRRGRPSAREVAAFVIERAMDGAWKVWGLKPPYSAGEADSFWRRYVLGHPGALRDYQKLLRAPMPWPPDHIGHDVLNDFFGPRGQAAHAYNLLTMEQEPFTVIILSDEASPPSGPPQKH
jgi:hypothetical protein